MRAVLRTLAQCHAHKILHRDIKPGNFMLLTDAEDSPLKAIGGWLSGRGSVGDGVGAQLCAANNKRHWWWKGCGWGVAWTWVVTMAVVEMRVVWLGPAEHSVHATIMVLSRSRVEILHAHTVPSVT